MELQQPMTSSSWMRLLFGRFLPLAYAYSRLPVCLQAEECLRQEEERVGNYLHPSTKPKLLKEVENEVLTKYEEQLLAKEHSGCAALLRDDKVST